MDVSQQDVLLEMRKVSKDFTLDSGSDLKVLRGIDFSIYPNEAVALLGPSGTGKSTALRIMAGLIKPTSGEVFTRQKPLQGVNSDIAMVFQTFALLPWDTVFENIALGLDPFDLPRQEVRARVRRAIDLVGLEGFEEAYPRELSGGMKQRVGLARAIVMERPILCLDEPFSALDILTSESLRTEVLNLWLNQNTSTKSMVLVTHNISEAVFMANRIVVMGTNPGHVRIEVKNELPYPRDENSPGFKRMVSLIHDIVTEALIPDEPLFIPSVAGQKQIESIETIPDVQVAEMLGLLELLDDKGGKTDIFQLSHLAGKDFGKTLFLAKSAELLDLVDTPRNEILLTDLGRKFIRADVNVRKKTLHELLKSLKLVQLLEAKLRQTSHFTLSADEAIEVLASWLPNENPDRVFDTLVSWGRYAELFGYNDDSKEIYLDLGQETVG